MVVSRLLPFLNIAPWPLPFPVCFPDTSSSFPCLVLMFSALCPWPHLFFSLLSTLCSAPVQFLCTPLLEPSFLASQIYLRLHMYPVELNIVLFFNCFFSCDPAFRKLGLSGLFLFIVTKPNYSLCPNDSSSLITDSWSLSSPFPSHPSLLWVSQTHHFWLRIMQ